MGMGSADGFKPEMLINDSRERRSPENFHPPRRPLESNEFNVEVTEYGDRQ